MSDFSDQLHLKSNNIDDAYNLLKRANSKGYIFQPINGWITILSELRNDIAQFNEGLLLYFQRTNDALAWSFDLFDGRNLISQYSIEDYFDGFIVKKENLNFDIFCNSLKVNNEAKSQLEKLFSIDNTEQAYGGDFEFAKLLKLENIEWIAYEYIDCDFEEAKEQFEGLVCFEP